MRIETRQDGPISVIELHGRLVLGPPEEALQNAVMALLAESRNRILLDMRGVPYVDSAGIGQLAACKKRVLQREGALHLVWVRGRYHLAVETCVELMFPNALFEDERQALSSFQ